MNATRSRPALLLLSGLVIVLGLASRRPFAPALVQAYVGDLLWAVLFFLGYAWLFAKKTSLALALSTVATTTLIELSQLYQSEWVRAIRATRLGGLLLGHQFLWSDVLCCLAGAALAAVVDASILRRQRLVAAR